MTTRRFSALALGAAIFALVAAGQSSSTQAEIGKTAPKWELTDSNGKTHKSTDFKGKTLVIEWFNPSCPWCKKIYNDGLVKKTIEEMKKMSKDGKEYVYLAINSTANIKKADVIAQSNTWMSEQKMKSIPVLIDYDGKVGKAFGARTTPHMYIIDGKGVLRYNGAFADQSDMTKKNYVLSALKQIDSGDTVAPDKVTPWGCGVKYAKGS